MRMRQHNALTYRVELGVIRLRDLFRPPSQVLIEAGVRAGMTVRDLGCGPGGFSLLAEAVTGNGPFDHLSDMPWSSLFGKRGCRPSYEAS